MKFIKYKVLGCSEVYRQQTQEVEQVETIATVVVPYSEAALKHAEAAAYNGEYTVEDDGEAELETADTVMDTLLGVDA